MSKNGAWSSKKTYMGMMVTMIAVAPVGYARRMSGGTEFGKQASRLGGRRFRDAKEALMAVRGWLRTQEPNSCHVGTCHASICCGIVLKE
jgi:hypothetical protein